LFGIALVQNACFKEFANTEYNKVRLFCAFNQAKDGAVTLSNCSANGFKNF